MSQRSVFPISLNLRNRGVIIIGHDSKTEQRIARLTQAGALVTKSTKVTFSVEELSHYYLVMLFLEPGKTQDELIRNTRKTSSLLYVHDCPDISDFSMPAISIRGPLKIAISTDGLAPALSRHFRESFDTLLNNFGTQLDKFIVSLHTMREALPPGQRGGLYKEAKRLIFKGELSISEESRGDNSHMDPK